MDCRSVSAYEDIGMNTLVSEREDRVRYYPGVIYDVQRKARQWHDGTSGDNSNMQVAQGIRTRITVKAGNIVELICQDSSGGRGFARIMGIMLHQDFVFLTLRWITETGRRHSQLGLQEFVERQIFENTCFHPITIVDEQKYVDGVYFAEIADKLYLNEWIFRAL